MDKFPKIETIEATLFAERACDHFAGMGKLSQELEAKCPEFKQAVNTSIMALALCASSGRRGLELAMSIVLARMIQAGVTAERARAECEQLQDAMNPRQLTEGRQEPHDCDTIT